jgi:hypothetical protein
VKLVRELYGTVTADRATAGLLVTTSYFSRQAIEFVENIPHQLSLKDYMDLKQWIDDIYLKNIPKNCPYSGRHKIQSWLLRLQPVNYTYQ